MSKFCCKYILRNNSNKLATFNYKRFKDSIWQYQVELKPNQIKSIFLEIETYSTPFSTIEIIEKICPFPPPPKPYFISVWTTTSPSESITLPLEPDGNYNFVVNWGDGSSETITTYAYHTYANPGKYTVAITGIIEGFNFSYLNNSTLKFTEVLQWGNLKIGNNGGNFNGCSNLTLTRVSDVLNLSGVANFENMFRDCSSLTTVNNMNDWDMSNAISLVNMFGDATSFNQNIGNWDMSNAGGTVYMFRNATSFNQDISSWNVSNVIYMGGMFYGATAFTQDISSWNVSGVTNMSYVFYSATSFNQNISSWNVSNVTNMNYMFQNATTFNQDLSGWCVTNIPSEPLDFATGASAWSLPKPAWGTCPQ